MHNENFCSLNRAMLNSLSVWFVRLIDRFPRKISLIQTLYHPKNSTCSRSRSNGCTKRLYNIVEPAGEIIHKTIKILIQ